MPISAFSEIIESVFRYVNTGPNWRLKNTVGDTKVVDGVDIAGPIPLATLALPIPLTSLATQAAFSLIANLTGSTALPTATLAGTDGHVLRRLAGALAFGLLDSTSFADEVITPNKRAQILRTYTLTASALASAATITIAAVETSGTWAAVASNRQQVPEAGLYEITVYAQATNTNTGARVYSGIQVTRNAINQFANEGTRFSTAAIDSIPIVGSCFVRITTPASELIDFRTVLSAGTVTFDSSSRAVIRKVAK